MRQPIDLAPGLYANDTKFKNKFTYRDANNIRFYDGMPEVIGGHERLVLGLLNGVCRNILPWAELSGAINIAFGTHTKLYAYASSVMNDITPDEAPVKLSNNPIHATVSSTTFVVHMPAHGMAIGDQFTISGITAIAGVTPNGTFNVSAVPDVDHFSYVKTPIANATVDGGGANVIVAIDRPLSPGNEHSTTGPGYGVGAYGLGPYGQNNNVNYHARTWSLWPFGQSLIANPRGGAIYQWDNDPTNEAQIVEGAPTVVNYALVTPERSILAFGTTEQISGLFNPLCVRGSDINGNIDIWNVTSANNAFEEILEGAGELVTARLIVSNVIIWSTANLYVGTFVGDPAQTYRFDRIDGGRGVCGPNAAIVVGNTAYWISPDLQFWRYAIGMTPQPINVTISDDSFGKQNTPAQADKITISYNSQFNELRIDYPDVRDGYECSRQAIVSLTDGSWSKGNIARSAFHEGSPWPRPIGVSPSGQSYYHENGKSADGGPLPWMLETNDFVLDELETNMELLAFYPDFKKQVGGVKLTVYGRQEKQGTEEYSSGEMLVPAGLPVLDFMFSGKIIRYKIENISSADTFVRFGVQHFDAVPSGEI